MIQGIKSVLSTLVGPVMLVVWTLPVSLIVTLAGALRWRGLADRTIRAWAWLVSISCGVRIRCDAPPQGTSHAACIVMANHTSLFDIPALILTTPLPIRFLAKKELFSIPVFGWAMYASGFVPVDRGRSRGGATAFAAARKALNGGVSLAIFPEETRSLDGRLGHFRAGGALLATATEVPVVPAGIRGAFEVRPKNCWINHPGTISVHYGSPINPGDFTNRKHLNDAVRSQVEALIGQPRGQDDQEQA